MTHVVFRMVQGIRSFRVHCFVRRRADGQTDWSSILCEEPEGAFEALRFVPGMVSGA